jgi:hypothetical protein
MGDKFFHPDGQKAQDIKMRGGRLVRTGVKKTGGSPSPEAGQSADENIRRRNQLLEESYGASGGYAGKRGQYGASGGYAGKRGQKRSGVSGYKTPKGQVKEGLDEAGEATEKPEEEG